MFCTGVQSLGVGLVNHTCVPHFKLLNNQPIAVVTRWGAAAGLLFQPGDRLLLGPVWEDQLLILQPRGYGSIMLGRRENGRLLAEPGRVPASPVRWSPAGGVVAVERSLERIGSAGGMGTLGLGEWLPAPLTQQILSEKSDTPQLDWTAVDPLVRHHSLKQGTASDTLPSGLVFGRTVKAARALPARPGWVRFVLLPPPATVHTPLWGGLEQDGHREAS